MFAAIAAFATRALGRIGGKLLELIVAIALLIVLVGGPYLLGMRHQSQIDQTVQAKAQTAAAHKLLAAQAKGQKLAAKLATTQAKTRVVYRTITKEVPHVVTVYREKPGAPLQPLPRFVFTVGAVRVWDRALDPELPAAAGVAVDTATGTDPALDSGINQQQLLQNHVDNAEACTETRQQLKALIAWHQVNDRMQP